MGKKFIFKVLILPIIIALTVMVSIVISEGALTNEALTPTQAKELFIMSIILFAMLYFFIIVFVLPIHLLVSKKIPHTIVGFILFNVVGFIFVYSLDQWLITLFDVPMIYSIFPLFSCLALLPIFDYAYNPN